MPPIAFAKFIAEIEDAIENGSPARCARMLRQVTHAFRSSANRIDERRTSVFDDVLTFTCAILSRGDAAICHGLVPTAKAS
jgi:hypothetical protein